MKLHHMMFAAAFGLAAAQPVLAQEMRRDIPQSNMEAENDLIRVLSQTFVRGDGSNGVPAGVNIFYTVKGVNRCAPRIQLWGGPVGVEADGPIGRLEPLPVERITNLVAQGGGQLKVEFNNGANLTLATNSEQHRRELVDALQAFGNACRTRASR
jgi:hypothetical protein